jgi:hypothetical protein
VKNLNQILYTGGKQKGPIEINKIIKFFAIVIIIFGIIIAGQAIYRMLNNKAEEQTPVNTEPSVEISQVDNMVQISISHDKAIDKIYYSWNEEEEVTLQGRGRTNLIESIDLPVGNNTLVVRIVDASGYEVRYEKRFVLEETTPKPQIEFAVSGNNVKVVITSENPLAYITYRWNDDEERRIDAAEGTKNRLETEIEIKKGENKLTVIAVDENNRTQTKEQKFKGITKPEIQLLQDRENLTIRVTDTDDKMDRIEFVLNGTLYTENTKTQDGTVIQVTKQLKTGDNFLAINAYNVSGDVESIQGTIPYNP